MMKRLMTVSVVNKSVVSNIFIRRIVMELWDIYDKNRNLTGRQMERGSEFAKGDFHLVIHVCIFNSKNEMLIQQR